MPSRRSKGPIADLFSKSGVKAPRKSRSIAPSIPPDISDQAPGPRHLLPKDLSGALKQLENAQIDSLLAAVNDEARRRGRLPAGLLTTSTKTDDTQRDMPERKVRKKAFAPRPRKNDADVREGMLKQGQINAVLAAFKAGVKPATIARKFGISQSIVRKAIASEARANAGK
jgi:DNA invertase Pin-like site-specific DNA recombinase